MAEKKLMVVVGGRTSEFEKAMNGVQKKMKSVSREMVSVGKGLTATVTLPIMAVGVAAVKAFGDFEQAMTASTAIMDGLSDDMRKSMETAAREVAKTTRFSATEAAESYYFLASAGLDAAKSIGALPLVAAFAQAGNFDMAKATDLLTDAQSALGLSVEDNAQNMENMTRVSDVLTKAQVLANASTEQFATALTSKAGNALRTVNKDVEEGVAVLAAFADQGIKGEAAGTLLTNTIFSLSDRARQSSKHFERLGIRVFDTRGEMRNTADIIADVETAFKNMTTEQILAELANMGFTKQAREGILALMGSSDALREYEDGLRNAGGVTQEVAENQMNNLWDQLGLIKDRLLDAAIALGETLVPIIREHVLPIVDKVVEKVGELAEWFGNLSPETQGFIVKALGLAAALGPVLFFLGSFIGALANIMPMVKFLAGSLGLAKLGGAFKLLATPVGWIALLVAGVSAGVFTLQNKIESLTGLNDRVKTFLKMIAGGMGGQLGIIMTLVRYWKDLKDVIVDTITAITNIPANIKEFGILGAAKELVRELSGRKLVVEAPQIITGDPKDAGGAGAKLVADLADGITSAVPLVDRSVMRVAEAIDNYLPHSPAKFGPLKNLPDFGAWLSGAITGAEPDIASTLSRTLAGITPRAEVAVSGGGGGTVEHRISGTLRLEGYGDESQFLGSVDLIADKVAEAMASGDRRIHNRVNLVPV